LEAYCVCCKEKREMQNPEAGFTVTGTPITRGTCSVCGTKLARMGTTDAHSGLEKPEKVARKPRVAKPAKVVNGKSALKKAGKTQLKQDHQHVGKLVIVESPAKAKTIGRFLGKGYTVRASIGHVRDLLRSSLSVDVEHDFAPKYRVPNEKRQIVKELKSLSKNADEIFLATDPDREGEAIAWHLLESAEMQPEISRRVVFHEITEPAIAEAFAHPREIDASLVDAQQARRILDRLVGYSLTPLLWQKVRGRLSAGRVQSVALRLVVEREREIEAFKPEEYWTIGAEFTPIGTRTKFLSRLYRMDDKEPSLPKEATVNDLCSDIETASFEITKIKKSERRRKPAPPFTTSTLQQEASRKLGFTARRTMAVAQQLYEGVAIDGAGTVGLITYMRTDSTNVSELAQNDVRKFISEMYGADFLPATAPIYKTRTIGAQEAHEAVRPTSVLRRPDDVKDQLTPEQFKLYQLIWVRFVSSQMEEAIYDTVSVEISGKTVLHAYTFRTSGQTIKFPGFLVVYEESKNEDRDRDDDENQKVPAGLEEGQKQHLNRLIPEQHFTQPPPRYSEASLVAALEENGIGRPSTYAPTISTIQQRGYVIRENKRLFPTETGILVTDLLVEHFPDVVDVQFTATMEADLDKIASNDMKWVDVVREFYGGFAEEILRAQKEMPEVKAEPEKIDRPCPVCGNDLVIRWGRYGKFISCSTYPTCKHTEPFLEKIGVTCPDDGGELVERKSRKGRFFYGCANYPECQFVSWKKPVPQPCPSCGGVLVIANKREFQCLSCKEVFLQEQVQERKSD
jgi:DNA topoisomerase I